MAALRIWGTNIERCRTAVIRFKATGGGEGGVENAPLQSGQSNRLIGQRVHSVGPWILWDICVLTLCPKPWLCPLAHSTFQRHGAGNSVSSTTSCHPPSARVPPQSPARTQSCRRSTPAGRNHERDGETHRADEMASMTPFTPTPRRLPPAELLCSCLPSLTSPSCPTSSSGSNTGKDKGDKVTIKRRRLDIHTPSI